MQDNNTDSEANSTSSDTIVDKSIKIFRKYLENEWAHQRLPKGLRGKLAEAYTCEETVTARIFLDYGGIKAWAAYFRATEGKAHFKGRLHQSVTITAFERLSADDRRLAATKVAGFRAHSTVVDVIDKIPHVRKRRRK
jgi:hypothetical protein